MAWKHTVKIVYWSIIWFIITCPTGWKTHAKQFPIGVVLNVGDPEFHNAFTFAMKELSRAPQKSPSDFEFYPLTEYLSTSVDFCQASHIIRNQICKERAMGLIPISSIDKHMDEIFTLSHKLRVPVISPWIPTGYKRLRPLDYEVRPTALPDAILSVISYYGYKKFIYLYSGSEGLLRLQTYYDSSTQEKESIEISFAKRFTSIEHIIEILHDIEKSTRWAFKFVVLDCPISLAKEVLSAHVRDHSLGRRTFHYLVTGFAFDEPWDQQLLVEISPLNVTGFQLIDRSRPIVQEYARKWAAFSFSESSKESWFSTDVAFIQDAVLVLNEVISRLSKKQLAATGPIIYPNIRCNKSDVELRASRLQEVVAWNAFQAELQTVHVEGLTGNIQFSNYGARENFSLNVMEVKVNGSLLKVGVWNLLTGYKPEGIREEVKKVFICTTVLESPYMMLKHVLPGEPEPEGNDRFEGFFKDFADELAFRLNITFAIQIADTYGSRNSSLPGGWSGMMGELVRNEADIGIGGMTANAAREDAVQLSKSIIFLGVSIMLYKPERTWQQDIFAFMRPLSRETWICIGLAYVGVSTVLFLIAKFNEKELHSTEKKGVVKIKPQFTISNSLWFTFASLVGQGTDLCPRSISARLVGSVWWFLILIVTSSYTANFAAIQTVTRMEVPINSATELANQQLVKYGYTEGGATAEFFRRTRVTDYRKMAEFIDMHKGVNVKNVDEGIARVRREKGKYAFLLESLKNKYTNNMAPCNTIRVGENLDTKGYVLGLSASSGLSMHKINTIILEMREAGIVTDYEEKWLRGASECGGAKDAKDAAGRLSLETLVGVFYILIFGLLVALVIQLFEFWFSSRKCSRAPKE